MIIDFGTPRVTDNPDEIRKFHEQFGKNDTERLDGVIDSILEKEGKIARIRVNPNTATNIMPERKRHTIRFQDLSHRECFPVPVRTDFEVRDYVKVISARHWYGDDMEDVPAIFNETSGLLHIFDYTLRS